MDSLAPTNRCYAALNDVRMHRILSGVTEVKPNGSLTRSPL